MIDRIVLTISIAFLISLFIAFAFFVATYGRLPMGGGEVLNWLFGWGDGK